MAYEIELLWQNHIARDDRNSPEEYPEMALITFDEFAAIFQAGHEAAAPPPPDAPEPDAPPSGAERALTDVEIELLRRAGAIQPRSIAHHNGLIEAAALCAITRANIREMAALSSPAGARPVGEQS